VRNARDSPAPLRDAGPALGGGPATGPGAHGCRAAAGPGGGRAGARLPVATRPRRHRDRRAHGKTGRWPWRHPRRRCRARERPDPVTRDRASGHRHLPCPVRTCCGHSTTRTIAPHPNLPSQPAGRGLAGCRRVVARLREPVQGLRIRSARSALTGWRAWEGQRTASAPRLGRGPPRKRPSTRVNATRPASVTPGRQTTAR
jgi:hypothetical protein